LYYKEIRKYKVVRHKSHAVLLLFPCLCLHVGGGRDSKLAIASRQVSFPTALQRGGLTQNRIPTLAKYENYEHTLLQTMALLDVYGSSHQNIQLIQLCNLILEIHMSKQPIKYYVLWKPMS
jgi:hypothetical protein